MTRNLQAIFPYLFRVIRVFRGPFWATLGCSFHHFVGEKMDLALWLGETSTPIFRGLPYPAT